MGDLRKIPVVYSEEYYVDIGAHVFPTSKYRIIKERIDSDEYMAGKVEWVDPAPATEEEVVAVHDGEYVSKVSSGTMSVEEAMKMEMPFSGALAKAAFTCCGGTITASRLALGRGAAVHLGGGFHHAFPDHGEGFCVFNDIAVSVKVLQKEKLIERALVIDCDLHQGNGTAYIFDRDKTVFTFSIHQQNNYPFNKPKGDLDIGLADYTRDKEYLQHLYDNIPVIISSFKPEIILYLAGADPYENDQLGNLSLSKEGLAERDNYVLTQALNFSVPVVVTLAGGYAADRKDTVDIHFSTVEECVKIFSGTGNGKVPSKI